MPPSIGGKRSLRAYLSAAPSPFRDGLHGQISVDEPLEYRESEFLNFKGA